MKFFIQLFVFIFFCSQLSYFNADEQVESSLPPDSKHLKINKLIEYLNLYEKNNGEIEKLIAQKYQNFNEPIDEDQEILNDGDLDLAKRYRFDKRYRYDKRYRFDKRYRYDKRYRFDKKNSDSDSSNQVKKFYEKFQKRYRYD